MAERQAQEKKSLKKAQEQRNPRIRGRTNTKNQETKTQKPRSEERGARIRAEKRKLIGGRRKKEGEEPSVVRKRWAAIGKGREGSLER